MARCLNCIHCDVCDTDRCEKERLYGQCSDFLHDADVVPKSEVERLEVELEAMRCAANSYKIHYENLAREIFEEIEKYWIDSDTLPDCARLVDLDKIAELKKKYTEDEG